MNKNYKEILGKQMAYIDSGEGQSIVFLHGNPASSFLWRNITPFVTDLGRIIVPDLIGMGDSEKLEGIDNPDYQYHGQYKYLSTLLDSLDLGNEINLVIHDWGSAMGFQYARENPDRIKSISFMEAIVMPLTWDNWPENARNIFQLMRSEVGEEIVLDKNIFVEKILLLRRPSRKCAPPSLCSRPPARGGPLSAANLGSPPVRPSRSSHRRAATQPATISGGGATRPRW